MVLRRSFLTLGLPFLLGACSGSTGGGGPLTNLGLAAVALHGQGELWAVEVSEAGEGARDRNGDGDDDDSVLFVHDLADGSLTELGLALGTPLVLAVGNVLVAFGVSEAAEGASDLNGDGDTDDLVLHVYDVRTGVTTSTELAMVALQPAVGFGAVAFAVSETAQDGQDLDGDGTTGGFVLHVYDSRTLQTTNAMRNVTSDIDFHDHAFGFTTDEHSAGTDLNGDGDDMDTRVFEMFDLPLGGIEQVPLAIRGRPLAVNADDWFLLVDEGEMDLDLNGDGDRNEGVIHEVHPHTHTNASLGLSSTASFGSTADGGDLGFVVREVDGLDHNGDGDSLDALAVFYSTALGTAFDPGLAIDPNGPLVFAGEHLGFLADEFAQDEDLNGDGDLGDQVVHVFERSTGLVVDLELDAIVLQGGGGRLLVTRPESPPSADWNGDGDFADQVVFYWDPLLAEATSTMVAGTAAAASADTILLIVSESAQGTDWNGDGDTGDLVYVLHDVATRTNTSLRVAVTTPGAGLTADGRGVLLVSESGQGRDLNGDGDTADSVLHGLVVP